MESYLPYEVCKLFSDDLQTQRPTVDCLRSLRDSAKSHSFSLSPQFVGYPVRWLRDDTDRIVGEFSLDSLDKETLALPTEAQEWELGYV